MDMWIRLAAANNSLVKAKGGGVPMGEGGQRQGGKKGDTCNNVNINIFN